VVLSKSALRAIFLAAVTLAATCVAEVNVAAAIVSDTFTIGKAQTLPTRELAKELLGQQIASKVIEAVRHEYDTSEQVLPEYVEFYTQPELTDPRINGICRTDVITVEYDWADLDRSSLTDSGNASPPTSTVNASTLLKIAHIQAVPRYKSFPIPPGEPGTPANDRAQAAACAHMTTAVDAFHAVTAGDAQWLAAIQREYTGSAQHFGFTCSDFADRSCVQARRALRQLKLGPKTKVESVDCPKKKTGDQIDLCYSLTFPYPGADEYSDRQDYGGGGFEHYDPEWVLTVFAGMHDGMGPVKIRTLNMEHVRKPIVMY
jgi:hypothetical protein